MANIKTATFQQLLIVSIIVAIYFTEITSAKNLYNEDETDDEFWRERRLLSSKSNKLGIRRSRCERPGCYNACVNKVANPHNQLYAMYCSKQCC